MCLSKKQKNFEMLKSIVLVERQLGEGRETRSRVSLVYYIVNRAGGLKPGLILGFSPWLYHFLWLNAKIILL